MSKRMHGFGAALDKLASKIENGELIAQTDPVAFIGIVTDRLDSQKDLLEACELFCSMYDSEATCAKVAHARSLYPLYEAWEKAKAAIKKAKGE